MVASFGLAKTLPFARTDTAATRSTPLQVPDTGGERGEEREAERKTEKKEKKKKKKTTHNE